MKFRYYVMSNAPHKRLPRKAKKRIQRMIKAGYPNKYSSAREAIKSFDKQVEDWRQIIKQSAIDASLAWSKFAPEPYPYGVPDIGRVHTLTRFSDSEVSVLKTT